MTQRDPRRLLDPRSDLHPNLRALLVLGREELPSAEQLERMAQNAGPEFTAPRPPSGPSSGPLGGMGGLEPLLAVGLMVALAGSVYWVASQMTSSDAAPESSAAPAARAPAADPAEAPARDPEPRTAVPAAALPEPRADEAEVEVKRAPRRTREPRSEHGHAPKPDPVTELQLLDAAQAALRTAPELALARANEHATRFPHGQFEQEREVLAVEALLQLKRSAAAEQRAERFLARFPASSYRERIERQRDRARGDR